MNLMRKIEIGSKHVTVRQVGLRLLSIHKGGLSLLHEVFETLLELVLNLGRLVIINDYRRKYLVFV